MILADSWYAETIPKATRLDDRVPARLRPLTERSGLARGLAMVIVGRHADAVVTTNVGPGAKVCMIVYGLMGHRKLVLLEYIVHQPERRDYIRRVWFRVLRQWLLGRALLRAQVLTNDEARTFPFLHRMPAESCSGRADSTIRLRTT